MGAGTLGGHLCALAAPDAEVIHNLGKNTETWRSQGPEDAYNSMFMIMSKIIQGISRLYIGTFVRYRLGASAR